MVVGISTQQSLASAGRLRRQAVSPAWLRLLGSWHRISMGGDGGLRWGVLMSQCDSQKPLVFSPFFVLCTFQSAFAHKVLLYSYQNSLRSDRVFMALAVYTEMLSTFTRTSCFIHTMT